MNIYMTLSLGDSTRQIISLLDKHGIWFYYGNAINCKPKDVPLILYVAVLL